MFGSGEGSWGLLKFLGWGIGLAQHGIAWFSDDFPVGRIGYLWTQIFKIGAEGRHPDPLEVPHVVDGLGDMGNRNVCAHPADFLPGRPDQSLGPPQEAQRIFLELFLDQKMELGRDRLRLGENVLGNVLPKGTGVGRKVGVLDDPVTALTSVPGMKSHRLVSLEDLDLPGCDLDPDLLVPKPVGEGVVGFFQTHGAVGMNTACFPVELFEGSLGKRAECSLLVLFEPLLPGVSEPGVRAGIDPLQQASQGLVDLRKTPEGVLSVEEEKIAADDLDRPFNKSLVLGFSNTSDDRAVMEVQFEIDIRIIQMRSPDARFQIIWHCNSDNTRKGGVHLLVSETPIFFFLVLAGPGKDFLAVAKNAHEKMGPVLFPGPIHPSDLLACPIDLGMASRKEIPKGDTALQKIKVGPVDVLPEIDISRFPSVCSSQIRLISKPFRTSEITFVHSIPCAHSGGGSGTVTQRAGASAPFPESLSPVFGEEKEPWQSLCRRILP